MVAKINNLLMGKFFWFVGEGIGTQSSGKTPESPPKGLIGVTGDSGTSKKFNGEDLKFQEKTSPEFFTSFFS